MKAVPIALAAMILGAPAMAQERSDEPALVEALVVNARTPGPAWWRVGKGDVQVWVLGTGVAIPQGAVWDARAFDKRVKAARRVIYPDLSGKTHFSKETMAADRPWIEELTPDERAKLTEVEARAKRPEGFYARFRPNMAGLLIKTDSAERGFSKRKLDLMARAKGLGARTTPVKGKIAMAMKASFGKGQSDGLACVRWALSPEIQQAAERERAQAWVTGDVRRLMARPMAYDPCVRSMDAMRDTYETHEVTVADEIGRTLDEGQDAVAFVSLVPLLREGGVLDQLRRRGYRIETPAQLDDED